MVRSLRQILFALTLFQSSLSGYEAPWHIFEGKQQAAAGCFNVIKREYSFSTEFELEWEGVQYTHAVKSVFHFRTHYDLYDSEGDFAAKGKASWIPSFGLGWLYSWAADLLVFDAEGFYVGSIDGTLYTDAVAKFIFRDAGDNDLAVAYMDKERNTFTLHKPSNKTKKIMELKRQVVPYKTDYWTVSIYDDTVIPSEMIKIFAVFACDRQDDFKVGK